MNKLLLAFLVGFVFSVNAAEGNPELEAWAPGCRPSGPAVTWDFTQGCPAGCRLRKCAALDSRGLRITQITNESFAAGCAVTKYKLPEAFLVEASFLAGLDWKDEPSKIRAERHRNVLLDTLYVTYGKQGYNKGVQIALESSGDKWTPWMWIGYGEVTHSVKGPELRLETGQEGKLSCFFDAAGRVVWRFNGVVEETELPCPGAAAESKFDLVLGDRYGSNFDAFNGIIRSISVTPCERERLSLFAMGRKAFERGEKDAKLVFSLRNLYDKTLRSLKTEVVQDGVAGKSMVALPESLDSGREITFDVPISTRVTPGWKKLCVTIWNDEVRMTKTVQYGIGPRFPERMPALIWLYSGPMEAVTGLGFTHALRHFGLPTPEADAGYVAGALKTLDSALVAGLRLLKGQGVALPENVDREKYYRHDRNGKPISAKTIPLEVSNPELVDYARRLARANRSVMGDHPSFAGLLPCSELRDHSTPSFHTEHLRYQKETGREVPPEINGKVLNIQKAKELYPNGVVPDDSPILSYYRWFWGGGDGWPGYTGAIAEEYRPLKRGFSFWDPAVRCPPCWGSGGNVDVLNQWVYAVPEPMSVAGPVEEMFAMAAGRPGQDVMIMTQLICYRSQIAPSNVTVRPVPQWVVRRPRAGFPSIPPDSLQEATWSMIAKPVKGIMYHGWGCVYETGSSTGYVYTNEETTRRLRTLLQDVVAPLGPTLLRLPREESPVAVLESFTTAVMGGAATWGWRAPAVTFLQRARLDPRVVYEQTLERDGFGKTKVLYAPMCEFLTPSIIEKIREFQKSGGILVADSKLVSALHADILIPEPEFKRPPALDSTEVVEESDTVKVNTQAREVTRASKEKMLADATELRSRLADRYTPKTDSDSGELIVFNRNWQGIDYVFAINDKRTFGDYVGQWGMTMEQGLPYNGVVTLKDSEHKVKAVYELSRGGKVEFTRTSDDTIRVPLRYETNDGRFLLFSPQVIGKLEVQASVSKSADAAGTFLVTMRVQDTDGKAVHALLPVEIRLFDSAGREIDGGGYFCAEDGSCKVEFLTNTDDAPGDYSLFCRDRASGQTVRQRVVR
ncbi:MAG: hypothetical protein IKR48_10390 [Kiritimatiellae bacterium]|nr:hypothetical protein [Kiritimatiellia bacterium]